MSYYCQNCGLSMSVSNTYTCKQCGSTYCGKCSAKSAYKCKNCNDSL